MDWQTCVFVCYTFTDQHVFCVLFRTPDSGEEITGNSVQEEYYNETFESDSVATTTRTATTTQTQTATATSTQPAKKAPSSVNSISNHTAAKPPTAKNREGTVIKTAPRSPKSPFASPGRRGSESESEDSFSLAFSGNLHQQVSMCQSLSLKTPKVKIILWLNHKYFFVWPNHDYRG